MTRLQKLHDLETTHTSDPQRMRADLLAEIAPRARSSSSSFRDLQLAAEAAREARAERSPEMVKAAEQIAAAKRELGLAA